MAAEALCKAFFELGTLRDLIQELIALFKVTQTEGSEATLDKCSVVEYLVADLLFRNQSGDT